MDELTETNKTLVGLTSLIEQIQSRTKVINDIVFETRLLAFNASIEAARAGAQGKGFAVVAEEVGKLAAMSGKAADEIRAILAESTNQVSQIVSGTKDKVEVGRQVAGECSQAFGVITSTLDKVGQAVGNIAAANKEQETGISQIEKAMGEMDQVTQKNSTSSTGLATESQRLTKEIAAMSEVIREAEAQLIGSADRDAGIRAKGAPMGGAGMQGKAGAVSTAQGSQPRRVVSKYEKAA